MFSLEKFLEKTYAQALKNDRFLVRATKKNERMLKKAIRRKLVDLEPIHNLGKPTRMQVIGRPEIIEVAYSFDQDSWFEKNAYTERGYIVIPRRKTAPVPTVWTRTAAPNWN